MLRTLSVLTAIAVGATAVYAQSAAISARKDAFKAMAGAAKEPGAMNKGDAKFDLAKAQNLFKVISEQSPKLKTLFPADSKTGETDALPVIWDKKADFEARFDKLAADATAALAAVKDEASFKAEFPKVMGNCGACHKEYKKPAS